MVSVIFAFRLSPFPILTYRLIYVWCHMWGRMRLLFLKHLTLLLGCSYQRSIYLSVMELITVLLSTCSVLFVLVFLNFSLWIYDYDADYGLVLLSDFTAKVTMEYPFSVDNCKHAEFF